MKWCVVKGFDYEVSNTGLVRRIGKSRPLAFSLLKKGPTTYRRVTLFKNGRRYYMQVHRLVALAYLPNIDNLPQIDHIDSDGENNNVANLEWVTASENIKRSFKNNPAKKITCSNAGIIAGAVLQQKASLKYRRMLGKRFVKFHPGKTLIKDAAVSYTCDCGVSRTASIMWKELRNHKGKCPECTCTTNRSNESLL